MGFLPRTHTFWRSYDLGVSPVFFVSCCAMGVRGSPQAPLIKCAECDLQKTGQSLKDSRSHSTHLIDFYFVNNFKSVI